MALGLFSGRKKMKSVEKKKFHFLFFLPLLSLLETICCAGGKKYDSCIFYVFLAKSARRRGSRERAK